MSENTYRAEQARLREAAADALAEYRMMLHHDVGSAFSAYLTHLRASNELWKLDQSWIQAQLRKAG